MTPSILGNSRVRLVAAVAAVVASGLVAFLLVSPLSDRDPNSPAGAAGIGDPYFPLDGNGAIDVQHYEIHNAYDFESGQLSGWTRVTLTATSTVTSFNLDFLLPVRDVRVDDAEVDFEISGNHEVVIAEGLTQGRISPGTPSAP